MVASEGLAIAEIVEGDHRASAQDDCDDRLEALSFLFRVGDHARRLTKDGRVERIHEEGLSNPRLVRADVENRYRLCETRALATEHRQEHADCDGLVAQCREGEVDQPFFEEVVHRRPRVSRAMTCSVTRRHSPAAGRALSGRP